VAAKDVTNVLERAVGAGVPAQVIGRTIGRRLQIVVDQEIAVDLSVDEAERVWSSAIGQHFVKRVA
jgi:hypothetical protein